MDPLSQLVSLLDPRGRMELRCLFGPSFAAPHDSAGPWRAPFHIVLRGECELWLPQTRETLALHPGTLAILPRGAAHTLRSASGPRGGRRAAGIRSLSGDVLALKTNLGTPQPVAGDADIEILCGEFEFRGRRRSALLEALPEGLAIEFGERPEFGWLEGLVRMMAHEIEQQQAGAAAIVAELSGALFTLAVRAHLDIRPEQRGVLGLMRNGRLAPALKAMLDEPGQPWTVATLAERCHLSRASFARLFAQQAGGAPLELLTTLRMELAARLLAQGTQDTATIGEAVGYRSEAAFNRAFARHAGATPGRFRRAAAASEDDATTTAR
jgi:AraC family transcriptional activator of mtrCDE